MKLIYQFLIICFYFIPIAACKQKAKDPVSKAVFTEPALAITEAKELLQNGDLILRTDDDVVSASLRNFSATDKTYSHCGMVYLEGADWFVYHLMAGDENPSDEMEREKFDSFVNPFHKSRFGIFRYLLKKEESEKMQVQVYKYMNAKTKFDKKFDLKSDDALYCAEMVYKGLKTATSGRVILPTTVRNNFNPERYNKSTTEIKRFEFIALDNLYLNPFCKEIKRFRYPNTSLERE